MGNPRSGRPGDVAVRSAGSGSENNDADDENEHTEVLAGVARFHLRVIQAALILSSAATPLLFTHDGDSGASEAHRGYT